MTWYVVGVHCANNDRCVVGMVNVAPAAYEVPEPLATVFQPVNVYPDRTGTVDDTVVEESVVATELAGAPVPPFAL